MSNLVSGGGYRTERAIRKKSIQPPCVSCPMMDRCVAEYRACEDFLHYLRTGRVRKTVANRQPTHETYERAFAEEDQP